MERHLDVELVELRGLILGMGGYVEQAIQEALEALHKREPARCKTVYEIEEKINQAQMRVDHVCLTILARQAPVGSDLRQILAIIKINSDLERMGDQAVNIAQNAELYLREPPLKPLVDIPIMAKSVQSMVRTALDSFVRSDEQLAKTVIEQDDQVDHLKTKILKDVVLHMKESPDHIERGLDLILIARNLERIGDHATNIAEDVIFSNSGRDIRHGAGRNT